MIEAVVATRARGLAGKFSALTFGAIAITMAGGIAVMAVREQRDARADLLREGSTIARMLAHNGEYSVYTRNAEALQPLVDGLDQHARVAWVRFADGDGTVLLERIFTEGAVPVPLDTIRRPFSDPGFLTNEFKGPDGRRYLDIVAPIVGQADAGMDGLFPGFADSARQLGSVQIGLTASLVNERLLAALPLVALATFATLLLGFFATRLLTRRITAPIGTLVSAANAIAEGDLRQRIDVRTGDEIEVLGSAFQSMVERLRESRDSLEDYQRSLELRVDERTAELAETTERAVELAERAEAASRAKSQFLANMSHEIRTPMNGVLGMLELLGRTPLTDRQTHLAETARSSADALLQIINDILDFSKSEAGGLRLHPTHFNLQSMIEDVCEMLATRAHEKKIELACWVPPELRKTVRADAGRLRQVLINLVSNAIKFTEHGEVVVRAELEDENDRSTTIRVEVRDTGVGIPAALGPSLFEPFKQADDSMTRKHGGTGLGLAISKQLIDAMGGTIDYESQPGSGSVFWFRVPLGQPREAATDEPAGTAPTVARDRNILVVDDNATNREILLRQALAWGMNAEAAENGPAALELLDRSVAVGPPIDVLILDVMMPGMDGLEVARRIRGNAALDGTRIVILTSVALPALNRGLPDGVDAYLTKPVRSDELLRCVNEVLGLSSGARMRVEDAAAELPLDANVLLVEDNPVNQEVALAFLEDLGCTATVAGDGRQALEALDRGTFDVVLMDCMMPVMDGFLATETIRAREASREGGRRIPIVALTAAATEEERRHCRDVGMDDYLAKPVRRDQLRAALLEWTRPAGTGKADPPPDPSARVEARGPLLARNGRAAPGSEASGRGSPAGAASNGVFRHINPDALKHLRGLSRSGVSALQQVIESYLVDAPQRVAGIVEALGEHDYETVRGQAHTLKSSSALLGAQNLAEICRSIETAAASGQIESPPDHIGSIDREFEAVASELKRLLQTEVSVV